MKKVVIASVAMFLSGCALIAPSSVGYGKFGQISLDNILVLQGRFRSPEECDSELRRSWAMLYQYSKKCTTEDLTEKFPYFLKVLSSPDPTDAEEYRFHSQPLCEAWQIKAAVGSTFENHCDGK